MRTAPTHPGFLLVLALGLLGAFSCVASAPGLPMPDDSLGTVATLYRGHCAACHGESGSGDGPAAAFLGTRPRDFRRENFRFTSSPDGLVASREDLEYFIRNGSPTSHMPANPQLDGEQLRILAEYVLDIRRLGVVQSVEQVFLEEDEEFTEGEVQEIAAEMMGPGRPLAVPLRPASYVSDSPRGMSLFEEHCASCHGSRGLGDGTEELVDELGRSMRARDLTRGEYRGGGSDRDLFLRIRCGLPGTPMPALGPGMATDGEVWQLVDHLRVLAGGR